MKRHILILFLLVAARLYAQDEKTEIVTDRPDFSTTPLIIPKGSIQVETGFLVEKDNSANNDQTNYTVNSTLIKYGINEHFEIGLTLGYLSNKQYLKETHITRGFSPLTVGIKIKLADENGYWPQAAVVSHLNLKTGSKEFNPDYTSNDICLAFAHTINKRLSVTYNVGAIWNGVSPEATFLYTLSSDIVISQALTLFAEVYRFVPELSKPNNRIDGGFLVKITPVILFDISGGIGLSENAPDYFLSTGLSVRLLK